MHSMRIWDWWAYDSVTNFTLILHFWTVWFLYLYFFIHCSLLLVLNDALELPLHYGVVWCWRSKSDSCAKWLDQTPVDINLSLPDLWQCAISVRSFWSTAKIKDDCILIPELTQTSDPWRCILSLECQQDPNMLHWPSHIAHLLFTLSSSKEL